MAIGFPANPHTIYHDNLPTYPSPHTYLELRLPADSAPAPAALGLWIVQDPETASNELRGVIDGRALEKSEGDGVDNDGRRVMGGVGELTEMMRVVGTRCLIGRESLLVVRCMLGSELHLVLVPVASTRFYSNTQPQRRITLARRYRAQFLKFHKDTKVTVSHADRATLAASHTPAQLSR
jgi:hypothetical protein